ncbi:MAG: hypothetical protein WCD89_10495 [Anaerocolumna sp.]
MFNYKLMSEDVKEMNMTQLTHNQFFIKDSEAWYRDYDREISCRNLVREIALKQGTWDTNSPQMTDMEAFDDAMLDCLQYGIAEPEGVLAMYYNAMWGMAEVRAWYIDVKEQSKQPGKDKLTEKLKKMKKAAKRLIVENTCDKLDEIQNDISNGYITAIDEISEFIQSEPKEIKEGSR